MDYIITYTGKRFHFNNPSIDEIDILDIAHSLALSCRFRCHCRTFYSVAEHSIRVSELVSPGMKLTALLHDATEAYFPDIPRPIKVDFNMQSVEDEVWELIRQKFCLPPDDGSVKDADNVLLATEARDLMNLAPGEIWPGLPSPLEDEIKPLPGWEKAEEVFLDTYREIAGGRN